MKGSQQKRSRWLYVVLVLMLLALLGFSTLPVLSSITQGNQSLSRTVLAEKQEKLETEALGYQLVLEREPDNQTALRGLLEVRLKQGDIKGAISPLESLAKLNPQQTDYVILLAQTKQQVSDYEGAAAAYRQVLASNPGNIKALQGMVSLLLQQDRPEGAIGLLQDTLKIAAQANSDQSNSVDITSVQLLLGQVYATQKRYAEAITIYDQALEADKQDFRPVLAKALVLQEQGKYEEAQPLFNTAVSLAPPMYKDQIKAMATKMPESEPETDNVQ